jgi:sigma-B regulation protein RsbU (phosphoserine phosphatase)
LNPSSDPIQINTQILEALQSISVQKPLGELFSEIMERSKNILQCEASSLLIFDETTGFLNFKVAHGESGELIKKYEVKVGQGISGWVAEHLKPVIINDCYADDRFDPSFDRKTGFITRNMLCVPLLKADKLIGVLQVINKQNNAFTADDLVLMETFASQCAIAIDNANLKIFELDRQKMDQELAVAWSIQKRSLPQQLPDIAGLETAALLKPATQVGGDYYNELKVDDKRTLFVVADVAGKGIPAALIVSSLHAIILSHIANTGSFVLMDLVRTLNTVLIQTTTSDKYVTAWFGLYNNADSSLLSINAGHNHPILLSGRKTHALEKGGIFLGSMDLPFEEEMFVLTPGDLIIAYTDGVTEAWNKANEDYGDAALIRIVRKHRRNKAATLMQKIRDDVNRHVDGAEQSDDFTCLIIRKR